MDTVEGTIVTHHCIMGAWVKFGKARATPSRDSYHCIQLKLLWLFLSIWVMKCRFLDAFFLQIVDVLFAEVVLFANSFSQDMCSFPWPFTGGTTFSSVGICTSTPPASSSSVALREMPASPAASVFVCSFETFRGFGGCYDSPVGNFAHKGI